MKNQDYKLKYSDLKLKFHDAVDVAFRLGYEAGAQGAQLQQMQQQQVQAQQAQMGGMPGQEGQPGDPNDPGSPDGSNGSELDQHIGTLEGMLSQSKPGSPEQSQLQKSLDGIKAYQSDIRQKYEFKKSEQAIKAISKAMNLGKVKNLTPNATKALNQQEKIVEELMKSMAEEEKRATEAITKTLDFEQLLKS